jgi:hypothetical protein
MLDKIAKLDAAVIRALLVAAVGVLGVVLGFFGVNEDVFNAQAARFVDALSLLFTAGGVAWAAWARINLPNPPLSDKAVTKSQAMVTKSQSTETP